MSSRIPVAEVVGSLSRRVHRDQLVWISSMVPRLAEEAIGMVVASEGRLNVNDALIALACREVGLTHILSFDADFDEVPWLRRVATPEAVTAAASAD